MSSKLSTTVRVRGCEALARKLYHHCRDSRSPYNALTANLGKIRNELGQIDELTSFPYGSDLKLVPSVLRCHTALEKLEVALVSYKCNNQATADPDAVSSFKSILESIDFELVAYVAAETPNKWCGCTLNRSPSQSSSSAWSVNNEPSSTSSQVECRNDWREVCNGATTQLQQSPLSLRSLASTPSWKSHFLELDPLSVPLSDATRLILGANEPNITVAVACADALCMSGMANDKDPPLPCLSSVEVLEPSEKLDGDVSLQRDSVTLDRNLFAKADRRDDATDLEFQNHRREAATGLMARDGTGDADASVQESLFGDASATSTKANLEPRHEEPANTDCAQPVIKYLDLTLQVSRPSTASAGDSDDLYSATPTPKAQHDWMAPSFLPQPLHFAEKHQIRSISVGAGESLRTTPHENESEPPSGITEPARCTQSQDLEGLQGCDRAGSLMKSNSCCALGQDGEATDQGEVREREPLPKVPPQPPPPRYSRLSRPPACAPSSTSTERRRSMETSGAGLPAVPEKSPVQSSPHVSQWVPRKSVDEVLSDRADEPAVQRCRERFIESPEFVGYLSFYGPEGIDGVTSTCLLDSERILLIVHFWNHCHWAQAERHLIGHLESLNARSEDASLRRVQHLLAVCASFQGHWDEALDRFMKVLRAPITDLFDLDDGDCAAAYWLGDLFAMQNRRADAVLAYAIAERGSLFGSAEPTAQIIGAEQTAVQLDVSKADFRRRWSQEAFEAKEGDQASSLLDSRIVSVEAAKRCVDSQSCKHRVKCEHAQRPVQLDQERTRASYLPGVSLKISSDSFDASTPWPLPFDPIFCLANVQRGRLLAFECDMLDVFRRNPEAKLPRSLRLGKMDCFTCNDLTWLITTIRACLDQLETEYSEIVNVQGTISQGGSHLQSVTHVRATSRFPKPPVVL
ncbi:hypothetical protein AC579_8706 [Lecanosticta acicola]|uniref:Uncharacterized protein n=1 Tax=Lecanosticta acicola TaxID=111012 RepID=A0AAI8Z366_9PEZI|nr:hypothetical protein AC579_8706 [Lecanosticta acicola]